MNLFLYINIFFLFFISYSIELNHNKFKEISIEYDYKTNKRYLLTNNKIQKLNNIVNIYNPYEKIAYISSAKNENGDLFITTNSENKNDNTRLVYGLKNDCTNYFTDNEGSYRVMMTNLEADNIYPSITSLIINNEEFLISISHNGNFESLNYKNSSATGRYTNTAIGYTSNVNKNTFIHLKFYNNSNYILNSHISKDGKSNFFFLIKIFFKNGNLTKNRPDPVNETRVEKGLIGALATCFEIEEYIECLYTSQDGYYKASVFDTFNLGNLYSKIIDENIVSEQELYSKCIYLKNSIGAFVYYLSKNVKPILTFLKLTTPSSLSDDYKLDNYLGPITLNSNSKFELGYGYAINDLVKLNDNNIIFTSVNNNYENIVIIKIKLLNQDKNVLINYYNIELKKEYNIKIYKDITSFTINNLFGIGMTNYNYNLSSSKTYSNYFIIGIYSSNNISISEDIDIFDEGNIFGLKIKDLNINIDNNIFGYYLFGIQIINILNENLIDDNLGFYLYSNKSDKKIELNESVFFDDIINFKVFDDFGVKKDVYSIIYIPIISEANFTDYISIPDSIEYFPENSIDLEEFYQPEVFYGKKSFINFSVKNCYKTCQTCSHYGNHINHHCETCSTDFPLNEFNNFNNCDSLTNEIISTQLIEDNTQNLSYIAQDIVSETTQSQVNKCQIKALFKKECFYSENYSKTNKDLIKEINKSFEEHSLDELLDDLIETNQDLFIEEENALYQITTSYNQNNKIYYNLSSIILGKCEQILKSKNNLTENESLIIFKVESYIEGYNIPLIDYEIYNPRTKNKIDLNLCGNEKIDIIHHVEIDENELFKYNPESDYYNDICYSYSTTDKTDIILNDRREEFSKNNLTLCENNCQFKGYDSKLHAVNCKCNIKTDLLSIFDSSLDIQKLTYNFIDFKNIINIKVMKCYYTLFTYEGIYNNIGNYILICLIFLYTIFSIIFCIKGYKRLNYKISKIVKHLKKKEDLKDDKNKRVKTQTQAKSKNQNQNKNKNKNNYNKNKTTIKNPIKKKKSKNNIINNTIYEKTNLSCNSNCKVKLNRNKKPLNNIKNRNKIKKDIKIFYKGSLTINNKLNTKCNILKYNDYELNRLSYKEALKYDKRTYFKYYYSLLKTNHPLFFSFVPSNDYNSQSIKICLFIFSFALYYEVTCLFYTENKMHVIYEEKGIYMIINELPITIYSSLISILLNMIIRYLSLTQKSISALKQIKQMNTLLNISQNLKAFLKKKFILFFIITYILLVLFWYYLACFCAVYKNTQIQLIKNTLISFSLSFLYYFCIYLIPGIFRIISLKKCKNNECMYNFSILLQLL